MGAALTTACSGGGGTIGATPPAGAVEVTLQRDVYGVWHIDSPTDAGAYFGAGYAAAQDRLLQMHLARLAWRGQLAEVLGPGPSNLHLRLDRSARLVGWQRHGEEVVAALEAAGDEVLALLEAYAAGVNRRIGEVAGDPAEAHPFFAGVPDVLAPLSLEPWTAADAVSAWNRFAWAFQGFDPDEIGLRAAADALAQSGVPSDEWAGELLPVVFCDESAAVVQEDDVPPALQAEMQAFAALWGLEDAAGCRAIGGSAPSFSHAWAVTGARSADGRAVLLGDPRIGVGAPAALFEWHMRGATFDARGAGVPGSPNMLVGFTPHVAWSVTALAADQSDLFLMEVDRSSTPWSYELDGNWLPMEEQHEPLFAWTGEGTETELADEFADLTWRRTFFGPLISDLVPLPEDGSEVALRAVPLDRPGETSERGLLRMMRARDVQQFRVALGAWTFPSTNVVFAGRGSAEDAEAPDRIGYVANGAHPVRAPLPLAGTMALDGDDSANDWRTYVPQDLKPWVLRDGLADSGVIFSGNHSPIGAWYPLPRIFPATGHTDRSQRLAESFETPASFDADQVEALRRDVVRPSARDLVALVRAHVLAGDLTLSAEASDALAVLGPWYDAGAGLDITTSGTGLAVELPQRLLDEDPVHEPLIEDYGSGPTGLLIFLETELDKLAAGGPAPSVEVAAFLEQSLAEAYAEITGPEGAASTDPLAWDVWYLANVLSDRLPRWQLGGGAELGQGQEPHVPLTATDNTTLFSQAANLYTLLYRAGVEDGARSMLCPGQSDDLDGSPFALDQKVLWEQGLLRPAVTTPAGVAAIAVGEPLVLQFVP
jgi:penicillin G amidase